MEIVFLQAWREKSFRALFFLSIFSFIFIPSVIGRIVRVVTFPVCEGKKIQSK